MEEKIREAILSVVPNEGDRVSNPKLLEAVKSIGEFADDSIIVVRDQLIAEGVLVRGRGRGGSVIRQSPPGERVDTRQATTGGAGSTSPSSNGQYGSYQHRNEAVLRPDVGIQDQFTKTRGPKRYRYDSSIAPELVWDESSEREFAEWLLELVARAAEEGDEDVFAKDQIWKGTGERFRSSRKCAARLNSLTQPFLNWAGKAERHQITVPTVPLFVHERHSTRAILEKLRSYRAIGQNLDLFGDPQMDIADKLDAYEHTGPWTNRMILGDSLQVMNSLLEYEGLGGQVQMIYIDPPYGVKFGSNFQPFVRKRDVKHGKDDEMVREPEMVKAYRDTWELGLHSYLSYLRDRLLLARELLTESGSIFVQISDENLHHIREIIDEVFGKENFLSIITFVKTTSSTSRTLGAISDYLVWYAKDCRKVKFHPPYVARILGEEGTSQYRWLESSDGSVIRKLTEEELRNSEQIPVGWRIFAADNCSSSRAAGPNEAKEIHALGQAFQLRKGSWKTHQNGFHRLEAAK